MQNDNFDFSGNKFKMVVACPVYLKYHSMGEYIFDHQWADFAQRTLG
jgi:predicted N-acyltransferase